MAHAGHIVNQTEAEEMEKNGEHVYFDMSLVPAIN